MKKYIVLSAIVLSLTASSYAMGFVSTGGSGMTKERAISYLCRNKNHQMEEQQRAMDFNMAMVEHEILTKYGLHDEAKALAIKLFSHENHHERRERIRDILEE